MHSNLLHDPTLNPQHPCQGKCPEVGAEFSVKGKVELSSIDIISMRLPGQHLSCGTGSSFVTSLMIPSLSRSSPAANSQCKFARQLQVRNEPWMRQHQHIISQLFVEFKNTPLEKAVTPAASSNLEHVDRNSGQTVLAAWRS